MIDKDYSNNAFLAFTALDLDTMHLESIVEVLRERDSSLRHVFRKASKILCLENGTVVDSMDFCFSARPCLMRNIYLHFVQSQIPFIELLEEKTVGIQETYEFCEAALDLYKTTGICLRNGQVLYQNAALPTPSHTIESTLRLALYFSMALDSKALRVIRRHFDQ